MNNIDTIIKYLSGDLEPLSKMEFEKALETNPDLAEEYELVLKIWKTAKENLAIEELPDGENREEFIAEIIAAYDIEFYGATSLSKKEQDFKDELAKVMQVSHPIIEKKNESRGKVNYRLSVILLAAAAVFILLVLPGPDINKLASDYYNPLDEVNVEQINFASRSEKSDALLLFQQGEFYPARVSFENNLDKLKPEDKLFYALCCNETGDQKKSLTLLNELSEAAEDTISYKANWYMSLFFIEQGDLKKAKESLSKILEADGIYHKKARRLLRKID